MLQSNHLDSLSEERKLRHKQNRAYKTATHPSSDSKLTSEAPTAEQIFQNT